MTSLRDIYTAQQICGAVLSLEDDTEHHYLGASSLYRRHKCPASAICEKIDGSWKKSENIGTYNHKQIEMAINDYGEYDDKSIHVINALSVVKSMFDNNSDLTSYAEMRVSIPDENGNDISFGTLDFIGIDSGRYGHIKDWKTGEGIEHCHESQIYQGRFYICGAILKLNLQSCDFCTVETAKGSDPVVEIGPRDRSWAIEFRDNLAKLKTRVINTDAEFAEKTGNFCQWCKCGPHENASRKCPVLAFEDRCAADVVGMTIPEPFLLSRIESADKRLSAAKQVAKACKAIIAEEEAVIIEAGGSASYKVQPGYEYAKIDHEEVVKMICQDIIAILPEEQGAMMIDKIAEYVKANTKTVSVKSQARERKNK
jgi:hypothetical protein